mmetsp:Transcript_38327/g.109973  ORF Transcript_38327/g.109973 Transcript_38327/m.109973 type:complete len:208 (-) Transcript_38327:59-682(-)
MSKALSAPAGLANAPGIAQTKESSTPQARAKVAISPANIRLLAASPPAQSAHSDAALSAGASAAASEAAVAPSPAWLARRREASLSATSLASSPSSAKASTTDFFKEACATICSSPRRCSSSRSSRRFSVALLRSTAPPGPCSTARQPATSLECASTLAKAASRAAQASAWSAAASERTASAEWARSLARDSRPSKSSPTMSTTSSR